MAQTVVTEVLKAWFGNVPPPDLPTRELRARWFEPNVAFDQSLRERFGHLVERALGGDLTDWEPQPRPRLALVLLLDQFTRNTFRGSARAFAGDARAVSLAEDAVATGLDTRLTLCERSFLYLPFEHAEDRELQGMSLGCFQGLLEDAPSTACQHYRETLEFARRHQRVIARFGRFPHRNAVLGRISTAEEADFLKHTPTGF